MLRIAVELPSDFASAGELLADALAYEAAGAAAVWLGPAARGVEPLTLLAAVATVTSRVRVATALPAPSPWPVELLQDVLSTLDRLSRDRAVLGVAATAAPGLAAAVRAGGRRQVMVIGDDEEAASCAARLGDGLLCTGIAADNVAAAFERARALRQDDAFELWARAPAPGGRAEWRGLLERYGALGATGVVVAHAPNLLDILRNPEEDDRQDLAMAVG